MTARLSQRQVGSDRDGGPESPGLGRRTRSPAPLGTAGCSAPRVWPTTRSLTFAKPSDTAGLDRVAISATFPASRRSLPSIWRGPNLHLRQSSEVPINYPGLGSQWRTRNHRGAASSQESMSTSGHGAQGGVRGLPSAVTASRPGVGVDDVLRSPARRPREACGGRPLGHSHPDRNRASCFPRKAGSAGAGADARRRTKAGAPCCAAGFGCREKPAARDRDGREGSACS